MRMHKTVAALLASVALVGCATDGPDVPDIIQPSSPTAWMEPIGTLTIPPSSVNELTYNTGNAFHRDLHASMKGAVPVIVVAIPQGTPLALAALQQDRPSILQNDPGIVRWTTRIRYTQGAVVACPISPPESGIWSLLLLAANIAAPWVNQYLTYRPAENYHAVAWYDRGNERIERVEFIHRSAVANINSMSCEQLDEL